MSDSFRELFSYLSSSALGVIATVVFVIWVYTKIYTMHDLYQIRRELNGIREEINNLTSVIEKKQDGDGQ